MARNWLGRWSREPVAPDGELGLVGGAAAMAIERWNPRSDYTKQEDRILRRLRKTRKLFAFLRDHRRELFDDAFQAELEAMYRNTGAGKDPAPPALLAMVVLLQG